MQLASLALVVIERAERELEAKILLARNLREQGFHVIIGLRENLLDFVRTSLSNLQYKFVWIDKSCPSYMIGWFVWLKKKGAHIVILEEEAWSPFNTEDLIRRRFAKQVVEIVDEIWSPTKRLFESLIEIYPDCKKKVFFTSHPRNDVMNGRKYKIDSKNGMTTISFFSTFGLLNDEKVVMEEMLLQCGSHEYESIYKAYLRQWRKDLQLFKSVLKNMPHNSGLKYIFRAHPAEVDIYNNEFFSNLEGFEVSHNTYIRDIERSDFIVHSGSTLAFDVYSSPVKTICIRHPESNLFPDASEASDYFIKLDKLSEKAYIREILKCVQGKRCIDRKHIELMKFSLPGHIRCNNKTVDITCTHKKPYFCQMLYGLRIIRLLMLGKMHKLKIMLKKRKSFLKLIKNMEIPDGVYIIK
jgi:surface carbohydrate biosynthesis protein